MELGTARGYEIPATRCPRINPEFLEEERRALPARAFKQEYMVEFVETEDQWLPDWAIDPTVPPLWDEDGNPHPPL